MTQLNRLILQIGVECIHLIKKVLKIVYVFLLITHVFQNRWNPTKRRKPQNVWDHFPLTRIKRYIPVQPGIDLVTSRFRYDITGVLVVYPYWNGISGQMIEWTVGYGKIFEPFVAQGISDLRIRRRLPMARVWPPARYGLASPPIGEMEEHLPPWDIQDRLLELYFTYIHPVYPLIYKRRFLLEYQYK